MHRRDATLRFSLPAAVLLVALVGCRPPTRDTAPDDRHRAEELAQRPLYTFDEADVDLYLRIVREIEPDLPRRVVHLGRKNIGQPYDIYLLGEFPYEYIDPEPIYCLSRSDCLVFCEHMFAMALSDDWWTFLRALQRLRYRDGIISMLTRNHYTIADWDTNNAYLFEDVTTRLGGGAASVPLTQTCRRARFFAEYGIGQDIPDQEVRDAYVPKRNVPAVAAELRDGDFVNIIRGTEKSQYAGHTGLIAIAGDGTVNLLHSAQPCVREQPLVDYLMSSDRCLGVKILRLRPDAERIMQSVLAASPDATEVTPATLRKALAPSPVMSTGAPDGYTTDWKRAMHMQAYRLTHDTPVDAELQQTLEHIDEEIGDRFHIPAADRAFGVLDLTDCRPAMIQPDVMFYGASVPKIAVVLAYFETHPDAVDNLVPAIRRELELIIKRSSNELAARYSRMIGLEKIQEILQSGKYRLYDKDKGGGIWTGKHYGIDEPRTGDPVNGLSHGVTIRQCLRYYLMMEQGELVNARVSGLLKRIFAAPKLEFQNDRFVRGLGGRDVTILRKSGLWQQWHLDTARVQHGDRLYLLAGAVHHPEGEAYLADMAAAVDDALCGPHEKDRPFAHRLWLHENERDFEGGDFRHGVLTDRGVVLAGGGDGPAYVSPVLESDLKFNEAVLSWNVDAPSGSGFCVEVRVGRTFHDSWSPWLYVGQWGDAAPAGEVRTKCDEGWIDVDYFRSDERYDRLQYRVRGFGLADGGPMRIERMGVCLSDTTGIPTALPRPRREAADIDRGAWQRRLPVPFRTQKSDKPKYAGQICSPTSVAMVMEYRGVDIATVDIADSAFDRRYRIFGSWPANVQAAYRAGVPGYLARFSDWDSVKRMIAAGNPLVISIVAGPGELRNAPYDDTDGHLIVLTGFDADGMVTVNDPASTDPRKGQYACWPEDLETVWMRAKGGTAYVLLPPQ